MTAARLLGALVLSLVVYACGNSDANNAGGSGGSIESGGGAGSVESATGDAADAGTENSGGAGLGGGGAGGDGQGGAAGGGQAGTSGGPPGAKDAGAITCSSASDPLKTGTASADAYDCIIIDLAGKYMHPDPMMLKSQVQQESSFQILATSPDSPCNIPNGWTDAESKSYGLIQTTPACGEAKEARLPNMHPNLTKDMASALWATSVFNPQLNLDMGIKTITDGLKRVRSKYPGCTEPQYVLMSAGAFNSGDDAVLGCGSLNPRGQSYATAVLAHYKTFAQRAGWANPY